MNSIAPFPTSTLPERLSVILLCDHGWINGGQAKVAIESALRLREHGVDVCFVAGVGPMDLRLIDAGVECHAVGEHDILSDPNRLRSAISGVWNARAAQVLEQCIATRDWRSTVIHVHGWAKSLSPSIGPVVTGSKAAHVYTLHEYFLGCPNGGFYNYKSESICHLPALGLGCLTTRCDARSNYHKMWRVARQVVLRSAGGLPSGLRELIYLAPEQREIMMPYVSPQARWHHLPNSVGPRPSTRVPAEENSIYLFIGRLSPEKGALVAAKAARLANVPIAFCGEGEEYDAIVAANPQAQMLGWLDADGLQQWMQRARCLLFPSLWYECYPLVVADALRAGLPLLVSGTSLAASLVEDRVAGRHVAPGDVDGWAEAMTSLSSDARVSAYSEAAFHAGGKLLGEDEYIKRLLSIYANVLFHKHGEARECRELAL